MTYIRWKEKRLKDNLYSHLRRGGVYRDAAGSVFLYVGYCDIDLKAEQSNQDYKGTGYVLILLDDDYTSPILDVEIRNIEKVLNKGLSSVYTNLSDNPKLGGRTLFIDTEEEHLLTRELYEFNVPDEVLWKIEGISCDYCDICALSSYPNKYLKFIRKQKTRSYEAYLIDESERLVRTRNGVFYDVSSVTENLDTFKDRMLRKLNVFLTLD